MAHNMNGYRGVYDCSVPCVNMQIWQHGCNWKTQDKQYSNPNSDALQKSCESLFFQIEELKWLLFMFVETFEDIGCWNFSV